jgi:hypothetical protein
VRTVSQEQTEDSLDGPGTIASIPDVRAAMQSDITGQGKRRISFLKLNPQPSGCAWKAEINAVIYSDGSYEGDEIAMRGMAARRDGIAAGVRYWGTSSVAKVQRV